MPSPARQLDLLTDWTPPETAVRFDEGAVRAGNMEGSIARAIALAMRDCGLSRPEIAKRMSAYLGQDVTKNMLDAYASQAREDHVISLPRFVALIHATRDRRLLQLLADMFGWAVIDRKHLPLIELAAVQERERELRQHAETLRRKARGTGAL